MKIKIAHVGFHKTGTTFLQNQYFNQHSNICYYPATNRLPIELKQAKDGQVVVISNENLMGSPWGYGAAAFATPAYSWLSTNELIFKRLAEIMQFDGVILGIREHASLILSLYKQFLHVGGTLKFQRFFDIHHDRGLIKRDDLFIGKRVSLIKKHLAKNVFIYKIRDLSEPAVFEESLSNFLEIKNESLFLKNATRENKGVEGRNIEWLRKLNSLNKILTVNPFTPSLNNRIFQSLKITPRDLLQYRLTRFAGAKFTLPEETRNAITSYYTTDRLEFFGK